MKNNKHREPTLYIVGNYKRADEIRHIIENEWGGKHRDYTFENSDKAYFVDVFGCESCCYLYNIDFKEAVANGLMKEYKLPEKQQFKPFDKVVTRPKNGKSLWTANYYSHGDKEYTVFVGGSMVITKDHNILPYNEQTAKLIGTKDEWKGDKE